MKRSSVIWTGTKARRWFVALVASIFSCLTAYGQHYTFAQFGQPDGLLNQDVRAMVQDRRGVLWMGTENGLFWADGSHFLRVESFRDAKFGAVVALHVDGAGRVWVLGTKQLVFFGSDQALHQVEGLRLELPVSDGAALASLPEEPNSIFVLWNGRLRRVRSGDGGLTWESKPVFSQEDFEGKPALQQLAGLAVDEGRKALWAGCGRELCELHVPGPDATSDQVLVTGWDGTRGVPKNPWASVMLGHDGRVWARGNGEVLRLDPRTWAVDRFGDPSGGEAPDLRYAGLLEDGDGSVLANIPEGLARLDAGNGARIWSIFKETSGLPPSQIVTMFFDRGGGLWLAPMGGGIWRWLGYGNWQAWTRSEGLRGNVIRGLTRDEHGQLWIATPNTLLRLDEAQRKGIAENRGKFLRETQTVTTDARGHLWAGTSNGRLLDLDPRTHRLTEVASELGEVYQVKRELEKGQRVWICAAGGISYVSADDNWRQVHRIADDGAPAANAWSLSEDRSGTKWFAAQGGIYRFAAGQWSHVRFPDGAALIDYPVLEAAPDGTLWLQSAMPRPLLHIRVSGERATLIEAVGDDIIGSDDVTFLKSDRRGWLWVGTDIGIYVFDGHRWVHCTQEDGLVSDDTDMGSVLADEDGSMWFGTTGGLSHLLHPAELFHVPPPQINVEDVLLNGRELRAEERQRFNLLEPDLDVHLFSTYYKRPRAVVFRYRLSELQNDWQTSEAGNLHFSGLAPGDYVLTVQAMDKRVHAFSTPINYPFTVLPPWYRRERTEAAATVLLLLAVASGWRLSLRRLKASEANLKQRVDRQTAQLLAEKEQLERAQLELVETVRRDALTGLLNRSAIFDVLARMRREALASGFTLSVIMADLDHFKSINDRCGHAAGDAVLRECADRFREMLRPGDAVGRYGGEELLIVIPGLQPSHAVARVEDIRRAIASRPVVHGGHVLDVTCSFGVAWLNAQHRSVESVVNSADEALYHAKQKGRNRVEYAADTAAEGLLAGLRTEQWK